MKNILITTTALASLIAGVAFADESSVKVGGHLKFQAGAVSQSEKYKSTTFDDSANQKKYKFNNDAHIYVSAQGQAENGVAYGANVRVKTTSESSENFKNGKTDKTYIWLESSMGRVELGSNYFAGKLLKVGAHSIAKGTGGASDGDWSNYTQFPQNGTNVFYKSGDTVFNKNPNEEQPMKVTWFSPRFSGFQFGLSFSPDSSRKGTAGSSTTNPGVNAKNMYSIAMNYTNSFNEMNLSLSALYEGAKNPSATINDYKSYELGAAVGKGPFSFAASYGDDKKSSFQTAITAPKQRFVTAAVAYENGPFAGSVSFFDAKAKFTDATPSTLQHNTRAYSLGLDYNIAAGFKSFVELTHFNIDYKASATAQKDTNKGTVVIVGTSINF